MSTLPRVLVVEANRLHARLVQTFLKQLGWRADLVEDASGALAALREAPYELVLLDLGLSDTGGVQLCRTIRAECGPEAPSIMACTGQCFPEERARLLASGFDGVLLKPITFTDVMKICAALVDGSRWRARKASPLSRNPRDLVGFGVARTGPSENTKFTSQGGNARGAAVQPDGV